PASLQRFRRLFCDSGDWWRYQSWNSRDAPPMALRKALSSGSASSNCFRISITAASSAGSGSRCCAVQSATLSLIDCALGTGVPFGFAQAHKEGVSLMALLTVDDEQPSRRAIWG